MSLITLNSLPNDGESIDAADVNTAFNTIVNDYNGSIANANIASNAAISTSKLELGGGSSSNIILNNNVALQAKNTGGSAQNLLYIGADNIMHLGANYFQGNIINNLVTAAISFVTGSGTVTGPYQFSTYDWAFPFTFSSVPELYGAATSGTAWFKTNSFAALTGVTLQLWTLSQTSNSNLSGWARVWGIKA